MSKLYFSFTCLFFILLSSFTEGFSATIYVNVHVSGGANNGTSWSDAYTDLQSALSTASSGDEIWVAQGTYYPTSTSDQTLRFSLSDGVALYGGFAGGEVDKSFRDFVNNVTTLSGDIDQDGTSANNSYTVVYTFWVSSATILDGFTISGGNAANPSGSNPTPDRSGGGFYNEGFSNPSNPTIRNCIFEYNEAASFGGAVYNGGNCNSDYENCIFRNNVAFGGGAVYNSGALGKNCSPAFLKCNFENNYASSAAGAVYNDGNIGESSPEFESCIFAFNGTDINAVTYAGAVYNLGKSGKSNPRFFNCLFNTNSTFAGGAVYSLGYQGESNPLLANCTLYNNSASFNGGALYANAGDAVDGTADLTVINCIFKGNTASPGGGDIFRKYYGCISISYSIVDAVDCSSLDVGTGKAVVCGAGMQYSTDPLFKDEMNGDFSLMATSTALDLGDNTVINTNGILEDLAGNARIYNTTVDLGAYEDQGSLPVELLEFKAVANAQKVLLSWVTITETNNDYFVVERSADGHHFTEIAREAGNGNSLNAHHYGATDESPLPGQSYYRLKQVDFNDDYKYSEIHSIFYTHANIQLFPNPTADKISIAFPDSYDRPLRLEIRNLLGNIVFRKDLGRVNEAHRLFTIDDLGFLMQGSYILSIRDDHQIVQTIIFEKAGL